MEISDYYLIGKITRPHGLKGEVTASLRSDLPNDASDIEVVFIKMNNQMVPHFIKSISLKGDKAYLQFDDVETLNEAQAIAKHELFLPKSLRPKSKKGEFYDDEVIGFVVEDNSFGSLGIITEVIQSGLQRLISVNYQGKELLIPINGPFIKKIDKRDKKMSVSLPEGYLDL